MEAPEPLPRARLVDRPDELAASLAGRWGGTYFYPSGRQPGAFHLVLEPGAEGRLVGRTREPNFSDALVATLDARVEGQVEPDGAVVFTKTYDGTGGLAHTVTYRGRLAPDGRALLGDWRVEDLIGGFVVHLGGPARELPLILRSPRSSLSGDWTGVTTGPGPDDPPAHLTVELHQTGTQVRGDAVEDDGSGLLRFRVEGHVYPSGRVRLAFRPPGASVQVDCHGYLAPNERGLGGWWERGSQRGLWQLVRA